MSFRSTDWLEAKLIDDNGQDIKIYKLTTTADEDGNVTDESYSRVYECKGWVIPFTNEREEYKTYAGYRIEADYSCVIGNTIDVHVNDKLILVDGTETSIREVINHYEFNYVAYRELILRKEGIN